MRTHDEIDEKRKELFKKMESAAHTMENTHCGGIYNEKKRELASLKAQLDLMRWIVCETQKSSP